MADRDLIDCIQCGQEPVPIGSDIWKCWWRAHWQDCEGATLDAVTLANLQPNEPSMAEHMMNLKPDPATDRGYGPIAGND